MDECAVSGARHAVAPAAPAAGDPASFPRSAVDRSNAVGAAGTERVLPANTGAHTAIRSFPSPTHGDKSAEASCPVRVRPLWLVGTLAFLSAPFVGYPLLWLGLTWRELRRATGDGSMHPVWHALSQFVPVYGWVRLLDHYQTIGTLAAAAGSLVSVHALPALLASLLGPALASGPGGGEGAMGVVFSLFGNGLAAAAVMHGQSGMNAYARALATGPVRVGATRLEWALVPLLLLSWGLHAQETSRLPLWVGVALGGGLVGFTVLVLDTRRQPPIPPDYAAQRRRPEPNLRRAVAALASPVRAVVPGGYRLVLTAVPTPVEPVLRLLRAFDDTLSDADARAVVARLPSVIADELTLTDAVAAQERLRAVGVTVDVR